jgi:hypothetical protein
MKKQYLLAMCVLVTMSLSAQRTQKKAPTFNRANKGADVFLHKQWWLGFKVGANLSKPQLEAGYNVISPTNYDVSEIGKKYKSFHGLGTQATFEVSFHFRGLSIGLQPTYRTNKFTYSNEYEWIDAENSSNRLILNYQQDQKIAYLDLPLIGKYEFGVSMLRPYVQFGYYASFLLDASKTVIISGTDYASGGVNKFENEPIIIGARDLFAGYHWGLVAGAGLNYNLGNVRMNFDLMYKLGMSNISDTQNRYGSDRLSGVGDSLDDMKLNNLSLSIGCLFPLRFLGTGFKSMAD